MNINCEGMDNLTRILTLGFLNIIQQFNPLDYSIFAGIDGNLQQISVNKRTFFLFNTVN